MSEPNLIQQQRQIVRTFRQAKQQHTQAVTEASERLKRETENAESTKNNSLQQANASIEEFRNTFKSAEEKVMRGDKNAWEDVRQETKIPVTSMAEGGLVTG